ncbi:uncharacterized protein TM35_000015220 [Trypanosoma theileri]|uniref:Uncharacterized protein n=1 Tax=Trypanosoma theileri TaxID=67003 RepID=A0A1X0PA02_9TRYP|nr:uncharacterized protein TM35_000015220 [Trypanosoma theileri]ORC93645.1 hypothetical protein TM35_000015220 [Trypanosoma theileri]
MIRGSGVMRDNSKGFVVLRTCFGNWDAVMLRNDGEKAVLVRDEQRVAEVTLRISSDRRVSSLLMSKWNSQCFSVRVGNVLYEAGPIELDIGDEIQLVRVGKWNDEDGLSFRVEAMESLGGKGDENLQDSSLKGENERCAIPSQLSNVTSEDSAWRLFLKDRLTKIDEKFSMWLTLYPSSFSDVSVDHKTLA